MATTLQTNVHKYADAGFSGLWVRTSEPDEAQREILSLAKDQDWNIVIWDAANGTHEPGKSGDTNEEPIPALRSMHALPKGDNKGVLIAHNLHNYLTSPVVKQTVFNQLMDGKTRGSILIVLSPVVQIPIELEKVFMVIEHDLPDRAALHNLAEDLLNGNFEKTDPGNINVALDAAAGMTRYEAEGAFALSLSQADELKPDLIWELKASTLKKSNLLQLWRGKDSFADLGGLEALKKFCTKSLAPKANSTVKPRGVLLLGVAGTGKSAFAKALGKETNRPTLCLDLGSLYGSLVGQTEQNVRQALAVADAMAPCILFVDEIEKGLAGIGGQGDSGVATRLFGTLLTWLSDHTSDVFFIGTCNNIQALPPEFSRAERFDGVFFLDLPGKIEKDAIWAIHEKNYGVSGERPEDTNWTGAEIRSCCRLAALLGTDLAEAGQNVVPVALTAGEAVSNLRHWAANRCLDANRPGVYQVQRTEATTESNGAPKRRAIVKR